MAPSLREDEQFVIEVLCSAYGGTWRIGEDPPDAYLLLPENEVALEISTLTQHVVNDTGEKVSRLSQDAGAIRLCDEINDELENDIPAGAYIILIVSSPINKIRKTKAVLTDAIKRIVHEKEPNKKDVEINQNRIEIKLVRGDRGSGKKIVGIVPNQNSSSDILANVQYMLSERISDKVMKCLDVTHKPLWLALFNDYWLAEPVTFELAMKDLPVAHSFDKICLVSGSKAVHTLYES